MRMLFYIVNFLLVCVGAHAAMDATAVPTAAQIEARGILANDRGRITLRGGGHTYELRFGDRALRDYANDLRGEEVVVRGSFDAVTTGTRMTLVIRPESVTRAEEGMLMNATEPEVVDQTAPEVAPQPRRTDSPEIRIRVEQAPVRQTNPPVVSVSPPPQAVQYETTEPEVVQNTTDILRPMPTGRAYSRDARAFYKLSHPRWGTRTIMTPSGGAIILNNQ